MATHSNVFAWRIPGMAEPNGLPSVGSHRVRHDWSNIAAAAAWSNLKVLYLSPVVKRPGNLSTVVVELISHVWLLWSHRLQPASLLCLWDLPDKNNGMGCHFLLQGIFLTQELNLHLLYCEILYRSVTREAPAPMCTYKIFLIISYVLWDQQFYISVRLLVES